MHPLGDVVHVGDVRPLLRVRVDAHVHQLPELRTQSACAYWACGGGGGGGRGGSHSRGRGTPWPSTHAPRSTRDCCGRPHSLSDVLRGVFVGEHAWPDEMPPHLTTWNVVLSEVSQTGKGKNHLTALASGLHN